MRSTLARLAGLLTLTLVLAACDDPSGVGLTVLDIDDIDPRARDVAASEVDAERIPRNTGFTRSSQNVIEGRILAGEVDDPVFGRVRASGYVDLLAPGSAVPAFAQTPIERAVLELRPNYVYGDTTATVTYDLFQVTNSWVATLVASDSTLAVTSETPIRSISVAPADTLVRIELPQSWVAANDSLIRAPGFEQNFHGFELRPQAGGTAVRGYNPNARMLVLSDLSDDTSGLDTTILASSQIFSSIRRIEDGAQPDDLLTLQNGLSRSMVLTFDLSDFIGSALATAFLRLEAAPDVIDEALPPNFRRSRAQTLSLLGLGAGDPVVLAEATYDEATQTYVFGSTALRQALQDEALGRPRFERYGVTFPRPIVDLGLAPIRLSGDAQPRLILLEVPTDD